jgi:hypothetical protein
LINRLSELCSHFSTSLRTELSAEVSRMTLILAGRQIKSCDVKNQGYLKL